MPHRIFTTYYHKVLQKRPDVAETSVNPEQAIVYHLRRVRPQGQPNETETDNILKAHIPAMNRNFQTFIQVIAFLWFFIIWGGI